VPRRGGALPAAKCNRCRYRGVRDYGETGDYIGTFSGKDTLGNLAEAVTPRGHADSVVVINAQ
jgi:hypothetical protein